MMGWDGMIPPGQGIQLASWPVQSASAIPSASMRFSRKNDFTLPDRIACLPDGTGNRYVYPSKFAFPSFECPGAHRYYTIL